MVYKTLDDLQLELRVAEATAARLKRKINEKLAETVVACHSCQKGFEIKDLTYIQTHYYEHPHGCTGGDTWHQGEGQWKCTCGAITRLYNKPDIEKLKHLFKDITKEYDR